MANHIPSASALVSSITAELPGRISNLFSVRCGILTLVERLGSISEDGPSEIAFRRACEELWKIDKEILSISPTNIEELQIQASIVQFSNSNGDLSELLLSKFLCNVQLLAA